MPVNSPWTEERTAKLKQLHAAGLSCAMIAADIGGVTRNAVISKIHRLGLAGDSKVYTRQWRKLPRAVKRRTLKQRRADDRLKMRARRTPETKPLPPRPQPVDLVKPESKRLTLAELHAGMCKYIEDDFPPWTYCGHMAVEGSSWCSYHRSIVFSAPVTRKQATTYFDNLTGAWR